MNSAFSADNANNIPLHRGLGIEPFHKGPGVQRQLPDHADPLGRRGIMQIALAALITKLRYADCSGSTIHAQSLSCQKLL